MSRSKIQAIRILTFAALLVPFIDEASPVAAETYYVRASGNDALDGLSPAAAFATIGRAAALLREPGDQVIVGPGTYNEGNIGPRGNGTPDNPIVFRGDPSGVLTEDLDALVTVIPPNAPVPPSAEDNTTGFLLFGRHDIVIEGFTIEGAADAGIQVRAQSSTGVDSTRITLRQNNIFDGRHGIQVLAAGDVPIEGNLLRGNTDVGLLLASSAEIPLRPFVRGNDIEQNAFGIVLDRTSGGEIVENGLVDNGIAIKLTMASDVSIHNNNLGGGRLDGDGQDLRFVGNALIGQVRLDTTGTALFQDNQIVGGTTLNCDPQGTLQLLDNELLSLNQVRGSLLLDMQRNEARGINASTPGAIVARDNTFSGTVRLFSTADLELSGNAAAHLFAGGTRATVTDNASLGRFEITAEVGIVRRNGATRMDLFQRNLPPPDGGVETEATWVVTDNVAGIELIAATNRSPLSTAIVRGNLVTQGRLQIYARGPLQVSHNEAAGVACFLSEVAPDVSVTNNTARGARFSGLIVVGAGNAAIEANTSSGNMENGLVIRRTKGVTVSGNTFSANGTGGLLVSASPVLGGDCNGDGVVTVNEVVVSTSIAMDQLPLRQCDAADFNGDELVEINEVVRAVAGALGFVGPVPPEIRDGEILVQDNSIEDNGAFGIKVVAPGSVSAIGNLVLRNGGIGIAAQANDLPQQIDIVGNTIGVNAAEGVLVSGSAGARVWNNFVFSNGQGGILLRNAFGVEIVNNLIYVNANDGIGVGVGTMLPSPQAMILNNTIYANDGWGVTIGTAGAPSEGTVISNNIIDRNGLGGIAAQLESLARLDIGFNLNNDGYSHEVTPSVTDFRADPRFVDPSGPDDILGGAGFADDDFLLDPASAAIDAGSATAVELGITGSAVVGLDADEGIVDMGFHYGADVPKEDSPSPPSE